MNGLLNVGSNDCQYYSNILMDDEIRTMFYNIKKEVEWNIMSHKGGDVSRLINIQSSVYIDYETNIIKIPLYRHPIDVFPEQYEFTDNVKLLKDRIENILNLEYNYFNHCLIQLYRGGTSHITDHCDKTLDIAPNTLIVNVSLGAVRYMRIKNKIKNNISLQRESARIKLENGSLFVLGWNTNRKFYHGIKPDNRDNKLKSVEELDFNSERISLTFRNIATFIDQDKNISGQGAKKNIDDECIDLYEEGLAMLKAFSNENNEIDFDWDKNYGCGFNCIDFNIIDKNK